MLKATSTDKALEEWDKVTADTVWGLNVYIYPGSLSSDKKQETAIGIHHYRFHVNARNTYSSSNSGIYVRADTLEECITRILAYMETVPEYFNNPDVSSRVYLNDDAQR